METLEILLTTTIISECWCSFRWSSERHQGNHLAFWFVGGLFDEQVQGGYRFGSRDGTHTLPLLTGLAPHPSYW